MSLTLSDLRRLLRKGLGGLTSTDLTDNEADELLNMSLWALEDKYPFEAKETFYTAAMVVDQYEYNLSGVSALDALRSVSYLDEDGKSHKLDRMDRDWFDKNFDDGSVNDVSGDPERFMREGDVLTIWPPPDTDLDTKTLKIFIKESVASLAGGADTTGLPRNWDEIVLQGAIVRGHNLLQDYDLRDKALNYQLSLERSTVTTESKEETDSDHAGLQVLWDAPR